MAAPSIICSTNSIAHILCCNAEQLEDKHKKYLEVSRLKLFKLNLNDGNQLSKNLKVRGLVTHRNYYDKSSLFHFGSKHDPTSLWECHLRHFSNALNNVSGQDLHIYIYKIYICVYIKVIQWEDTAVRGHSSILQLLG